MTIQDKGIYEELKDRGNEVYWHWRKDIKNLLKRP